MKKIICISIAVILIGFDLYAGELKVTGPLSIGTSGPPHAMLDVNSPPSGYFDGFESNTLLDYTLSGNANWVRTSDDKYSGAYSAKAGTISHNQYTSMKITKTVGSGNVAFARKVSSEAGWDFLRFYIDGQLMASWSGSQAWAVVSYAVTAGNHTFEWRYDKDGSVNSYSDTAWIDDISFPNTGYAPAAVFNGGNVGIGTLGPQSKLSVGSSGAPHYAIFGAGSDANGIGVYGYGPGPTGYGVFCHAVYNANGCGGTRAWYYSSDEELKENIATLDEALPKIKKLRGVSYNWKQKDDPDTPKRTDKEGKKRQIGMIAQEVMEVVPEAVGLDPDGNLAMSDGPIVALLTEAVKEQQRQIEAQQAQIEALMVEVEKLKKKQ